MATRALIAFAAAASMSCSPALAQSANSSCFTSAEFEDALLVAAPIFLDAIGKECSAALPHGIILGNPQSELSKAINAAGRQAWPNALPAIKRVMGDGAGKLDENIDNLTYDQFLEGIKPQIPKIVKDTKDCVHIDKLITLLQPLSPKGVAAIFIEIAQMSDDFKKMTLVCE